MNEDAIRERVQLGIEYLSNSYGGATGLEWLSTVDSTELDMGSNSRCILGQITGDFVTSPLIITFGFEYASKWGFYLNADDLADEFTYDALTDEWQKRIDELKMQRADKLLALASAGLDDSWREDDV